MQSVLIVGTTKETKEKALEICKENKISKFDISIIETEKAVGIGEIRTLQKTIFLKPVHSEKKAVILEAFLGMTNDSQNAFLKILEEPPNNTVIIIIVNSLDFILPTVLSRCVTINLYKKTHLTEKELTDNLEIFNEIKNGGAGVALKFAQDYSKDKQTALDFLEKLLLSTHDNLNRNDNLTTKEVGKILTKIQKTHTIIKTTNVNVRFALENLFLNL